MKRVLLAPAAALLAAALYFFDPAETPLYPPCLIRVCTGRSCPGCGATRAMHALLHGRAAEAWELNPLWTAAAPALGAWLAWDWMRAVLARRKG